MDLSKYDRLCIETLPVVNHKKEVVCGLGFYHKEEIILCGGEIPVYEYLKNVYKDSLFLYMGTNDYIRFKQIKRKVL